MMKHMMLSLLSLLSLVLPAVETDDLAFLEAFAWGDRTAALQELVPDTREYFYYHCLDAQLSNDRPAFHRMLQRWLAHNRNRWTPDMLEMRRRQMLLEYDDAPEKTWAFLREDAGLTFNHRRRDEAVRPAFPAKVDPAVYGLGAFLQKARQHNGLLNNLTSRGLELALSEPLTPEQRRAFLGQLTRPDLPGLVELILADLAAKDSRGFGHHPIHRLLTTAQLVALGERRPSLLQDAGYVAERMARIQPPPADLSHDPEAAVAYYQQLWGFVQTLGPVHASVQASTLYRLLHHQRQLGEHDEELFRTYLRFPRPVPYLHPELRKRWQRDRVTWVNFRNLPVQDAMLPPIGGEEALVKAYLIELLQDDADPSAYAELFESSWLRAVFAESKILHGVGEPGAWASMLSPQAYRALLERVEVNFAPVNPSYLQPGDAVELQVELKQVEKLLVKVYALQTFNAYTTYQRPIDQAVDLDGMRATHERTLEVNEAPGRRVTHTLSFPEIQERGVYVVELIGNGVSSRALLHVGHLEAVSQATSAGQAVMVLNDQGQQVKNARLWMNGREFAADEKGLILLPFSENPGTRFVVLRDGDFCSPEQLHHLGESYRFTAGIHVDRQSLDRRSTGQLLLRPDLRIHGFPLPPSLLKEVKVTLTATDAKGVQTEREYTAEFSRHAEWARTFYVPDGLRQIDVRVEARLTRKLDGEEITLSDQMQLAVNSGRAGDRLRQVLLTPSRSGWALEVRGLNGEVLPDVPLQVTFHHPGFQVTTEAQVTTDSFGRVGLGALSGVARVEVSGEGLQLDLPVAGGASRYPERMHLQAGEEVSLPYPWDRSNDLEAVSLFKTGRGKILADRRDAVQVAEGELRVAGLEAGTYSLVMHEAGTTVELEVLDAGSYAGFLMGNTRRLQETAARLPSFAGVETRADEVLVRLRNVTPSTRVAIRAYRYAGSGGTFPLGQGFAPPAHRTVYPPHTQYISGREIGDEYRYVLERKFREVFAGSLLERPGLILNPWEIRETTADREALKADEAYRGGQQRLNAPAVPELKGIAPEEPFGGGWGLGGRDGTINRQDIGFDFLPEGSRWWVNLRPEDDGSIRVPLENPGEHTALDIVLVDRFGTSRMRQGLPEKEFVPDEVRLVAGLDPEQAFSRQKTVRRIDAGSPVVFPDVATTRFKVLGDLEQAFDVLATLCEDPQVEQFSFLKGWHRLEREEKLRKYGEFASHELHLFLYMRDRDFFDQVVRPYLANKKDKTFVDRWLLDDLAPEENRLDRLRDRNALERALLSRRGGNPEALQAGLREEWELLPPDPEAFARRVQVALQSGGLDEEQAVTEMARRENAMEASGQVVRLRDAERVARNLRAEKSLPAPAMGLIAADAEMSFALEEVESSEDAFIPLDALDFDGQLEPLEAGLYRALPKTKEWAEQNYYRVRDADDVPERLTVNRFWRDVAAGVEVSPHLLACHRNLTDLLVALAFCGLPAEAADLVETPKGAGLQLEVNQPAILVTEQILPAEQNADARPLLMSQQFFRPDDRYRMEGNERVEKFITGEFIRRTVYGTRVTLTNPTASPRRLNLLMQIPLGAIPVNNGFYTDDRSVRLNPYTTQTVEYFFTFPESGTFAQFPAHAAAEEAVVGQAEARVFEVKNAPTEVDKTSWAWVSQVGSEEEVLQFLKGHNLRRLDLAEVAWRLKEHAFYEDLLGLLKARNHFDPTLFSYGIYHQDPEVASVWLAESPLARQVGPLLESPLLTVRPDWSKHYEHLEYDPLVNPRVHAVGAKRTILNSAFREQYRRFLSLQMYRESISSTDQLALVVYLLMQDRLSEAQTQLAELSPNQVEEQVQLDYLHSWMALRTLDVDRAMDIAEAYTDYPVARWRNRFAAVTGAVKASREEAVPSDADPSRQQRLDRLADREPTLELEVVGGKLNLTAYALESVTVNLYPMDIELLFSRRPFLTEGGQDFAVIQPAWSEVRKVKRPGVPESLELPAAYRDQNMMVEVTGRGVRKSVVWMANQLNVRTLTQSGQVEVRTSNTRKPLPKTYVKVFARGVDGTVSFWKDGYTDLRGRFDYVSLNDREPEEAAAFSILILHPERGAEIQEATPPVR
jgi:hypothetical protein